jgi:hypothetical protein
LVFVLLLSLSLTACASFWLSDGLSLLKIAPDAFETRTVEQRVAIAWPGGQKTLEAVLDIHPDSLTVIGLAFGVRLFSFDYDGEKIILTQPLRGRLSATRIVNDMLMVYAPLDALADALPTGWTVCEKQQMRQVFQDERLAVSIHYPEGSPWQGRVVLDNHALGYQLTLDSREVTADEP